MYNRCTMLQLTACIAASFSLIACDSAKISPLAIDQSQFTNDDGRATAVLDESILKDESNTGNPGTAGDQSAAGDANITGDLSTTGGPGTTGNENTTGGLSTSGELSDAGELSNTGELSNASSQSILGDQSTTPDLSTTNLAFEEYCQPIEIDLTGTRLLGNGAANDKTPAFEVSLPDGMYNIKLSYTDTLHGEPGQPDQPAEQWYILGMDAMGDVKLTTTATDDLEVDAIYGSTDVGYYYVEGIVSITGVHAATSSSLPDFNSIEPAMVHFYPGNSYCGGIVATPF